MGETALKSLKDHVERLWRLTGKSEHVANELAKALKLPEAEVSRVRSVRIGPAETTYGGRADEHVVATAKDIQQRIESEYRERGIQKMLDILDEYGCEIDAVRAVLPTLAAKAAIEVGVAVRDAQAKAAIIAERGES